MPSRTKGAAKSVEVVGWVSALIVLLGRLARDLVVMRGEDYCHVDLCRAQRG